MILGSGRHDTGPTMITFGCWSAMILGSQLWNCLVVGAPCYWAHNFGLVWLLERHDTGLTTLDSYDCWSAMVLGSQLGMNRNFFYD